LEKGTKYFEIVIDFLLQEATKQILGESLWCMNATALRHSQTLNENPNH